jgi:hypothetical protein
MIRPMLSLTSVRQLTLDLKSTTCLRTLRLLRPTMSSLRNHQLSRSNLLKKLKTLRILFQNGQFTTSQ